MAPAVAVLASLAFIGWLIYRAVKGKTVRAHTIAYAISVVTGIYTLAFFLSMDISPLIKILVSIIVGVALIFLAAWLQKRRQGEQP